MDRGLQSKWMRPRPSGAFPIFSPAARSSATRSPAARRSARATLQARTVTALDYSNDTEPGITRESSDGGFVYRNARGRVIRHRPTLARIERLVIPPAWQDVW